MIELLKQLPFIKILLKFATHKITTMVLIFLDIGGGELLLIIAVILVIYGPAKIPEIARKFGKGFAEIKKASSEIKREIDDEVEKLDHQAPKSENDGVVKEKENEK